MTPPRELRQEQETGFWAGRLQQDYPAIWDLLNQRGRQRLPQGLAEYLLSSDEPDRRDLSAINSSLMQLTRQLGAQEVGRAYRSQLFGAPSEDRVRDLWCEITLVADLADLADELVLHPKLETGKHSEFRAVLGDHEVWGEVKRLEDPCPTRIGAMSLQALTMKGYEESRGSRGRPRSQKLRQQLNGDGHRTEVPAQLPNSAMGLLFLFHTGDYGFDANWIQAALFGDGHVGGPLSDHASDPDRDGLFSLATWSRVSACCFVRADDETGHAHLLRMWHNPGAARPLPPPVIRVLEALGNWPSRLPPCALAPS